MKKLLLTAMMFTSILGAFARKVTFQVDMAGQTVSANGVHLVGNFKDVNYDGTDENPSVTSWDPTAISMSETSSGSGIYAVQLDLAAGLVYEFKFVNGNDWNSAESVPAICQVEEGNGNGNRWYYVENGTSDITMPALKFSGSAPANKYAAVFKVDLGKNTASSNGVHIAGNFQDPDYTAPAENPEYANWDPAAMSVVNYEQNGKFSGTVYRIILYLKGTNYEYKFVNDNGWGGAESVPSGCATNSNRGLSLSADKNIGKICFGECAACPTRAIPQYNITFRVDMSNSCDFDTVDIAGGKINGWAGGTYLTKGANGVWSVTLKMDSAEIQYKFRKLKGSNVSWEGLSSNRMVVPFSDTVLAINCFDATVACTPVPAPSDVTFKVDMTNEIAADSIFVIGSFTTPQWQAGALKLTVDPNNSNFYSVTVNKMCPGSFYYKFCNGDPNKIGEDFPDTTQRSCNEPNGLGGFNRTYKRTSASPVTLFYVYNSCVAGGSANTINLESEVTIAPNPAVGNFNVSLAGSRINNIVITSLDGRVVRTMKGDNASAMNVSVAGLNGIYLVNITDNMGRSATKKIVLQ